VVRGFLDYDEYKFSQICASLYPERCIYLCVRFDALGKNVSRGDLIARNVAVDDEATITRTKVENCPRRFGFELGHRASPLPAGAGTYAFDFLVARKIPRQSETVFITEGAYWNSNSEAYNMTNASLANVQKRNTVTLKPKVRHKGLNYLFFDDHVSRQRVPPHSIGVDFGTFVTVEGDKYAISSTDDNNFRALLGSLP
jgi:hypothetical protein